VNGYITHLFGVGNKIGYNDNNGMDIIRCLHHNKKAIKKTFCTNWLCAIVAGNVYWSKNKPVGNILTGFTS